MKMTSKIGDVRGYSSFSVRFGCYEFVTRNEEAIKTVVNGGEMRIRNFKVGWKKRRGWVNRRRGCVMGGVLYGNRQGKGTKECSS